MSKKFYILLMICPFLFNCALEQITRGNDYLQSRDFCKATEEFKEAIALKPKLLLEAEFVKNNTIAKRECAKIYYQKGIELSQKGSLIEAIDALNKSVELDANNANAREALDIAKKNKSQNDQAAETAYQEGLRYFQNKDWINALNAYKRAIELNPNHISARAKLAEIEPEVSKAEALYNEAMLCFVKKQWDEALQGFDKVLSTSPHHNNTKLKVGEVKKEQADARDCYGKGKELHRSNSSALA